MGLSRGLGTACFAFLVHDSDILMYLLYERGQIADESFVLSQSYYFGSVAMVNLPSYTDPAKFAGEECIEAREHHPGQQVGETHDPHHFHGQLRVHPAHPCDAVFEALHQVFGCLHNSYVGNHISNAIWRRQGRWLRRRWRRGL